MEKQDTRSTAWDAVNNYSDLLARLDGCTDRLSTAISESRFHDLDTLIAERELLCRETASFATAARGVTGYARHPAAQGIHEFEKSILRKQSECESDLADRLGRCRSELVELRRKKGLKSAYGVAAHGNQSCFLDNRT